MLLVGRDHLPREKTNDGLGKSFRTHPSLPALSVKELKMSRELWVKFLTVEDPAIETAFVGDGHGARRRGKTVNFIIPQFQIPLRLTGQV